MPGKKITIDSAYFNHLQHDSSIMPFTSKSLVFYFHSHN
uniref:Uncharacterized protein n=1 Tax=Rhizophora mucronata TaxID=61149 RepID=A0A2P2NXS2_RHIMU